jgi:hypothetical protein
MDDKTTVEQIEAIFAASVPENKRLQKKELEKLIKQLSDPKTRHHYEMASDHFFDMIEHLSEYPN